MNKTERIYSKLLFWLITLFCWKAISSEFIPQKISEADLAINWPIGCNFKPCQMSIIISNMIQKLKAPYRKN